MSNSNMFEKRPYGKSGDMLSIIGFGGIVVANQEQSWSNAIVAEAIERGINYFDVAPTYANAEEKLGPALEPYRKDVFLACKTNQRHRDGAEADWKRSCELLRTDYFDLYQLHGILSVENDVDPLFIKGGVMDMLVEKKKEGRIRHLGFSAHSHEAALTAMERFDFDSALFPVNFATFYQGNFGQVIFEATEKRGMSRLALKAMAKQHWVEGHPDRQTYAKCWYEPLSDPEIAELALRWTLSQPITSALPPGDEKLFRMAMDFGERFKPITPEETKKLRQHANELNPIFEAA